MNCCRFCQKVLENEVINLGNQPPSNAYLSKEGLKNCEVTYPLKVFVCEECWLVQIPEHSKPEELFTENYAYLSSTSTSWCNHAENYVKKSIKNLNLNSQSNIVEIASNDGYLLQYFLKRNYQCLGIEPTKVCANASIEKGINTIQEFFGTKLAKKLVSKGNSLEKGADLVIANNVLAHVPDINDFMKGIEIILKAKGNVSIEFPHLLNLIKNNQFDTIYHEHYSYLSLSFIIRLANKVGLKVYDVEQLSTHGGSLRVWLKKDLDYPVSSNVENILNDEIDYKLESRETYTNLQSSALSIKYQLINYLLEAKKNNKSIIAYGAAAKGNTLLNFAGIRDDLITFVIDKAKSKQGMYLPGSHIPIKSIDSLKSFNPDEIIVLPWNLIEEIREQLKGYKLVTFIPKMKKWG